MTPDFAPVFWLHNTTIYYIYKHIVIFNNKSHRNSSSNHAEGQSLKDQLKKELEKSWPLFEITWCLGMETIKKHLNLQTLLKSVSIEMKLKNTTKNTK